MLMELAKDQSLWWFCALRGWGLRVLLELLLLQSSSWSSKVASTWCEAGGRSERTRASWSTKTLSRSSL